MKKILLTLTALFTLTVGAYSMSYEQARQQALFLTDKMAYELNLTDEQYQAAYEINLDYLLNVNTREDVFGDYWRWRLADMEYILLDWQYRAFCDALYFYRPLYWDAGYWHFRIYARYPHRSYFFFGRPDFWYSYRGGHSWRHNGGRSWYHGRDIRPPHRDGGHHGMKDRFDRGDFRNGFGKDNGRGQGNGIGSRNRDNNRPNGFGNRDNNRNNNGNNRPNGFGNRDNGGNKPGGSVNPGTGGQPGNGNGTRGGGFGGSRGGNGGSIKPINETPNAGTTAVVPGRNRDIDASRRARESSTRSTATAAPATGNLRSNNGTRPSENRSTFGGTRNSSSPSRNSGSFGSSRSSNSTPSRSSGSFGSSHSSSSHSSFGGSHSGGGSRSGGGHFGGRR